MSQQTPQPGRQQPDPWPGQDQGAPPVQGPQPVRQQPPYGQQAPPPGSLPSGPLPPGPAQVPYGQAPYGQFPPTGQPQRPARQVPPVPQAPQGGFAASGYPPVPPALQQPGPQRQVYGAPPAFGQAQPYQQPFYQPYAPAAPKGMSIAAMVLGLVGVVTAGAFIIPQILAVVLGHVALSKEPAGKGMAIAGLVLGYVVTALSILYWVMMFFFWGLASSDGAWD
ncbi:DUF4190 domain-containing protein [Arthrobacter sp. NPDC090010]|uniref:DUF4190 domain-containing protein n=1 Tax=Arthrobacter sp. NPDC090010 TaxID=3363942 RepID=UPI0037F89030